MLYSANCVLGKHSIQCQDLNLKSSQFELCSSIGCENICEVLRSILVCVFLCAGIFVVRVHPGNSRHANIARYFSPMRDILSSLYKRETFETINESQWDNKWNESRFLLSVHARNSRQLMRANETINKMRAAMLVYRTECSEVQQI